MAKMWAGRTDGTTDRTADDFNSSIGFDSRMFRQDIKGSMAHAAMLSAAGIIAETEADTLISGLRGILDDIESGTLLFDPACEDIHMFVEEVLTSRVGDVGKKLHTARSRNDQVALDLRMYLMEETDTISAALKTLIATVTDKAECYSDTIMPGYTHLQRAQPVTFGHHLMAYAAMFKRDLGRLADCRKRTAVRNQCIGCNKSPSGHRPEGDLLFQTFVIGVMVHDRIWQCAAFGEGEVGTAGDVFTVVPHDGARAAV